MSSKRPEVWLRGPVDGVPPALQHVAHALLQAAEDVETALSGYPKELLWTRPGGVASVGFHLQHMAGVVDRLFTYARDEPLSDVQREALRTEEMPRRRDDGTDDLLRQLHERFERALAQLRSTEVSLLHDPRPVGRARLPSTVLGLLSHAGEHVQRHTGQLLVTARIQLATL